MIYSPNLSIIIKALEKVRARLGRDFGEIINLQNNPFSAAKFAAACYNRIKENLTDDLIAIHPDYNLEFIDGEKFVNDPNAAYSYIICPIDGLLNLSRAIPYFTTAIGISYKNKKDAVIADEIIACAFVNIAGNELFFAEKGGGAFLNNRRLRIGKKEIKDNLICAIPNIEALSTPFLKNKLSDNITFNFRLNDCSSLDCGYLAANRYDLVMIDKKNKIFDQISNLLIREAGGIIAHDGDFLVASNFSN